MHWTHSSGRYAATRALGLGLEGKVKGLQGLQQNLCYNVAMVLTGGKAGLAWRLNSGVCSAHQHAADSAHVFKVSACRVTRPCVLHTSTAHSLCGLIANNVRPCHDAFLSCPHCTLSGRKCCRGAVAGCGADGAAGCRSCCLCGAVLTAAQLLVSRQAQQQRHRGHLVGR